MNSTIPQRFIAAGLALAGFGAVLHSGAAQAVAVTVDGVDYNITTFVDSYNNATGRFTIAEMPWWSDNSGTEAMKFSNALGLQLGSPNDVAPPNLPSDPAAPFFAYKTYGTNDMGSWTQSQSAPSGFPYADSRDSIRTYAVIYSAPPQVPGPLPVFGALAGFSLSRRLRTRIKVSSATRATL